MASLGNFTRRASITRFYTYLSPYTLPTHTLILYSHLTLFFCKLSHSYSLSSLSGPRAWRCMASTDSFNRRASITRFYISLPIYPPQVPTHTLILHLTYFLYTISLTLSSLSGQRVWRFMASQYSFNRRTSITLFYIIISPHIPSLLLPHTLHSSLPGPCAWPQLAYPVVKIKPLFQNIISLHPKVETTTGIIFKHLDSTL